MTGCRPPTRPKKRPKNVQRIVDVRHWCSIISFVVGLFHLFLIVQILGFLLTMPNTFSFDAFQRLIPGSRLNRVTRELYNVKGPFSLSLFSFGCLRNKILTTYLMLFSWNLSNEKYGMFSFSHLFLVTKRGHTYPYSVLFQCFDLWTAPNWAACRLDGIAEKHDSLRPLLIWSLNYFKLRYTRPSPIDFMELRIF